MTDHSLTDVSAGVSPTESDSVGRLATHLGASWPFIVSARALAAAKQAELNRTLGPLTSEDITVVVFGSIARQEYTSGSDIDWTLLVDGMCDPQHVAIALEVAKRFNDAGLKKPGREGIFGGLSFGHDLLHYIGGGDDTNANLTLRQLLLLESVPIGHPDAYDRVVRNVIRRYILEDYGWVQGTNKYRVPRFLQNDIARYWRTLAVDFAFKRQARGGEGWALRTAKLRLSRKLTYAAGLLMCFSCATDVEFGTAVSAPSADAHPVVEHLWEHVRQTPLAVVADTLLKYPALDNAARGLFASYDRFLSILDDPEKRQHLDTLAEAATAADSIFQEVREVGHAFQQALDTIFLTDTVPRLFELTKTYGVF